MKKMAVILATALTISSGIQARPVIAAAGIDKGVVSTDYISFAATVEAIDYEKRTITLRGPENSSVTLRASKEVQKFGEIRKGNLVTAEYLDAVAIVVRKADGASHPGYLKEVTVTQRGKDPDGLPVDTITMLGTVEVIDYNLRTVTVKAADGTIKTYKADIRVKKLKDIIKGDKIYLRVTEPLAVRIKPVEK